VAGSDGRYKCPADTSTAVTVAAIAAVRTAVAAIAASTAAIYTVAAGGADIAASITKAVAFIFLHTG